MKKLFLLLLLSFFSTQGLTGSCPDGSEPVKSISADGTYFVYNCAGSNNKSSSSSTNSSSSASTVSNKNKSKGIDRFGGISEIPEEANPNDETLKFYLYRYLYSHSIYPYCGDDKQLFCEDMPPQFSHPVEASNNPYQFHSDLREDKYIRKQMQTTPLLSYLLYEDGKIVIDEITPENRFGDMFRDSSKFHSQSVAKTFISYVAGHAICKGYIDSVDSRLDDWPILQNTLYHNQKLIDVLNMASGTQEYFIGANKFKNSSRSVTNPTVKDAMENELKGSKKSNSIYNYNNMNPNVVGSYLIYKLGDDNFQELLNDVFKKKARIEGDVFFLKNISAKKDDLSIWSQFYATRYDYLRIAKAMLDDWQNDTCAGQYLKTIYEKRINKGNYGAKSPRIAFPEGYAGFFHTGYKGMGSRPVMSMDGYGGQTITIDFEKGRIIATQAIHDNMMFPKPGGYDWKKIVYERIKNGKPSSKTKPTPKPDVDSQQVTLERDTNKEIERKAKQYWDDYYDCSETTSGKSNLEACIDKIVKKRERVNKLTEKLTEKVVINTYGGEGYISENESPNFDSLKWSLYRKLHYRPLSGDRFYSVQASNPFNFQFDLREDSYIKQQMQTTPLLSYLLFEDGKIVVDEITPKDRFGDKFSDTSMFHSMSMGKSITSYLTGHAICEGKIKSVDSRIDWPILKNTLYDNQQLINLLNMASGDKAYSQKDESNESIQSRMATEFKGSKKSNHQYHYTNLNTNLILSYLLYTYGEDDFKRLFDDVFQKKVGIKNEVWLNKTPGADKNEKSLGHQFFTTRYDFLRIAKAMLDDWQKDNCVGQYLKTIHERRIPKNGSQGTKGRVGLPLSYGGFFHTGYKGMENRPVMGMDGNGGQTILIDFDRGRIVVTQSVFDNMRFPDKASYNWEKISYERIKNGKPTSKSISAKSASPLMDPQELILHNKDRRESDRKAKEYWDEYYDKIFFGGSDDGEILLSEDFENLDERDILTDDRDDHWLVKQDSDGNSIYCNKNVISTSDYANFNLGSQNWRDYSISYRMKFTTGRGGELETHIRKNSNRQGEYRSVIDSMMGYTFLKYVKGADRINKKIANGSRAPIRDKWADIQLIASGKNIVYIVNGKVVASTEDGRLKKGAVMFAVTSKSELCIDDIVIKKEGVKEETSAAEVEEEDKFKSEKNELFKNIVISNNFNGNYGFTNMKPPSTLLGNGTLEINKGLVKINQGSGDLTPKYDSFEGRIDQNGDIKAIFYFAPCRSCGLEDKLVVFEGNINKKKLSGMYKNTQIYFYLTSKN